MNIPHYHKAEFKCRKCGKEQSQLVLCGSKPEECPCMFCQEKNMWLGHIDNDKSYPVAVISPIQKL